MTSLEALLKEGTKVLEEKKIQEARLDAWLLLEYVTGVSRALYFADPKKAVEEEKAEEYRKLIVLRAGHIPLQHITHQAYFMWMRMCWFQDRTQRRWWRKHWRFWRIRRNRGSLTCAPDQAVFY